MLSNVCGFFHIPRMRLPTPLWLSSEVGHQWLCDDEFSSEMKTLALSEYQMLPECYIKAYSALRMPALPYVTSAHFIIIRGN